MAGADRTGTTGPDISRPRGREIANNPNIASLKSETAMSQAGSADVYIYCLRF
jgi:hypothetical protein